MGLSAGEVAETSGFVIVTFMTGLVAVFPLIALLDPSSLETLGISRLAGIATGILGLVLMAGYIGLGWWVDRPIRCSVTRSTFLGRAPRSPRLPFPSRICHSSLLCSMPASRMPQRSVIRTFSQSMFWLSWLG